MRTDVKVIEDSISENTRLTTLELEYPHYIHPEFMTHRVFSRNGQSFRAIPLDRLIDRIEGNKWYPIWVKNNSGMEAKFRVDDSEYIQLLNTVWDNAKTNAIEQAKTLSTLGVHKQLVNRIIMPFSTIKMIVSATDWNNFFRLRIHHAAQQEIQELAIMMKDALIASTPTKLKKGEWHLPYVSQDERVSLSPEDSLKLSTARCARVSYLNHNGVRDIDEDFKLHDRLKAEKHMSPFEHCATPFPKNFAGGNFRHWRQYRYLVERDMVN